LNLTNEANTHDWLTVSRGMKITAYIGAYYPTVSQTSQKQEEPSGDPIFGANIKDAINIIREWLAYRKL
jgi:hypothetical protein